MMARNQRLLQQPTNIYQKRPFLLAMNQVLYSNLKDEYGSNIDETQFSKTFSSNHFTSVCDRKDALISVLENLDMYRKRAEEASKSRANIIVFPEVSCDM